MAAAASASNAEVVGEAVGVVGFVGLGSVGEPMAANAVAAGFETVVFDPRPEPVERLVGRGARRAGSVAGLGARADVVQIMVGTDDQVRSVVGELAGAGALREGRAVLLHSTLHPDTVAEVAERLAARGIAVLDAPVSGPEGAEAGARARDMTFMVGGSAELLARVRPLLEASGPRIHHLGAEPGAGQLAKLAANAMTMVSMESVRQVLRFAEAVGIDPGVALDLWRDTSGNSWAVERWRAMQDLASRHPGGASGLSALGKKDLSHFLDLARRHGVPTSLAERALELLDPELADLVGTPGAVGQGAAGGSDEQEPRRR